VLAVVRHADRTPKQKMKMKVAHPAILALLRKHGKKNKDEESPKKPSSRPPSSSQRSWR